MAEGKLYMAIDPGKNGGFVIINTTGVVPEFMGKFDGSNLETVYAAFKEIQKLQSKLEAIGVEGQFSTGMGGSASSVRKLANSAGWIAGVCRCLWPDTPLYSLAPSAWSGPTGVQGLPKKERLEMFLKQACITDDRKKKASADLADAYFMAKYLRTRYLKSKEKLVRPQY